MSDPTSTASPPSADSPLDGVGLAISLGIALLLLSFARIGGEMTTKAFGGEVLNTVLAQPIWHTALGRNLVVFALTLVALHAGFGLLCWIAARLSRYAFPGLRAGRRSWVLLWFLAGTAWILIANATRFTHSALGEPYADLARVEWMGINAFRLSSALLATAIAAMVAGAAARRVRSYRRLSAASTTLAAALLLVGVAAIVRSPASGATVASSRQPNVIFIGIDALRPDVTGTNGQALAPNVGRFMSQAVTFSDAITPLARTFPSWVSILSGRSPHTTGAVVNLLPRDLIHTGDTLGDLFRHAGYQSIYSIDETQFSNVDATYGFDEAITPPIGATDFVLTFFGDTPLSNLLVNSAAGALLFPNLYANRGAAATYDPDEYVHELERKLRFDRPTFLAVHLTLSHWPYSWATSPGEGDRFGAGGTYEMAVRRVDRQFQDILSMLERRGALSNALVIVLSDHGEGLGKADDFPANAASVLGGEPEHQKRGHGTSILSPHQYRTVLAMRQFGPAGEPELHSARVVDTPVSLVDLAPTVADLLALHAREPYDGRSLVPLLRSAPGADASLRERVRFTETEFNPNGVSVEKVSASGLANAAKFYHIDPDSDRVELRPERVPELLRMRQYAALLPGRMLAAIPDASGQRYDLFTLQDTAAGAQWMARVAGEAARDPETSRLVGALEQRFGLDLHASRPRDPPSGDPDERTLQGN